MTRNAYYVTTAIAYPNGEPHIGHAYEMVATDAIARWRRLEGREVFFLTGTDEHGLKMVQTAQREGLSTRELADRNAARFKRARRRAQHLQQRLHPHHRGAALQVEPGNLEADGSGQQWRHLPVDLQGLVLGPRRGLFRRGRTDRRRGRQEVRALRRRSEMGRGGQLFLPPLGLSGPAAEALRGAARLHRSHRAAQRNRLVRQARAAGRLDLQNDVRLGHSGAGRAGPRDVCVDRCADQLHHRRRLPRRQGRAVPEILAGRPARHRQGHHPLPHGLLAGLPDERRPAGAEARLRPRLPDVRRQEDEQVARQRRRSVRRSSTSSAPTRALLLPARNLVGAGRRLGPREVHQPQQRRPRQQFRQSGAAVAVDDRQEFRRPDAAAAGRLGARTTRSSPRRSPRSRGWRRRWSPSSCTKPQASWSPR